MISLFLIIILLVGCGKKEVNITSYEGVDNQSSYSSIEIPLVEQETNKDVSSIDELFESIDNPFLTSEELGKLTSKGEREEVIYLKLAAVFCAQNFSNNSYAVINGQVIKEKDFIDNKEVIKINQEEVILRDANKEYILRMRNILN